ncbi:MAG: bifunctional glycosyltransferase family 2/GtrA family protein [Lachnospiraceae bacterium]|nr:bifunctional glycosyltransferase family 2/GtrA family protein [Lachnospiraceae bacterium]
MKIKIQEDEYKNEGRIMNKSNISVIIPAYEPDDKLITTLHELIEAGFDDILVVDDGSSDSCKDVFAEVLSLPQCTLLRHEQNKGKGAALKTAFSFFLKQRPKRNVAVTADADGQHLTKDIEAVSAMCQEKEGVVLGVRDFSAPQVPSKSKLGNRITSGVFRLFFGMKIQDTQTGLRAFSRKYLESILKVSGERYEYETNMLFAINKLSVPLWQVKIETVYLEDNKSSHFRVVRDSLRVYGLIIKYLCSSAAASVVDVLAYYFIKRASASLALPIPSTFGAAFIARIISSLLNYVINAKVVFQDVTNGKTLVKYYGLAAIQIGLSAAIVYFIEHILCITTPGLSTLLKVLVDTVLFFFSFRIQHKWVFNEKKK